MGFLDVDRFSAVKIAPMRRTGAAERWCAGVSGVASALTLLYVVAVLPSEPHLRADGSWRQLRAPQLRPLGTDSAEKSIERLRQPGKLQRRLAGHCEHAVESTCTYPTDMWTKKWAELTPQQQGAMYVLGFSQYDLADKPWADHVEVVEELASITGPPVLATKGLRGMVVKYDAGGDALIRFNNISHEVYLSNLRFVKKKASTKLTLVKNKLPTAMLGCWVNLTKDEIAAVRTMGFGMKMGHTGMNTVDNATLTAAVHHWQTCADSQRRVQTGLDAFQGCPWPKPVPAVCSTCGEHMEYFHLMESKLWTELHTQEQKKYEALGWNATAWASKSYPDSYTTEFNRLNSALRDDVLWLGYTEQAWAGNGCRTGMGCLQRRLYTERRWRQDPLFYETVLTSAMSNAFTDPLTSRKESEINRVIVSSFASAFRIDPAQVMASVRKLRSNQLYVMTTIRLKVGQTINQNQAPTNSDMGDALSVAISGITVMRTRAPLKYKWKCKASDGKCVSWPTGPTDDFMKFGWTERQWVEGFEPVAMDTPWGHLGVIAPPERPEKLDKPAMRLGYQDDTWGTLNFCPKSTCQKRRQYLQERWGDITFSSMTIAEKRAWSILGQGDGFWVAGNGLDNVYGFPGAAKCWDELTPAQTRAARSLGHSNVSWAGCGEFQAKQCGLSMQAALMPPTFTDPKRTVRATMTIYRPFSEISGNIFGQQVTNKATSMEVPVSFVILFEEAIARVLYCGNPPIGEPETYVGNTTTGEPRCENKTAFNLQKDRVKVVRVKQGSIIVDFVICGEGGGAPSGVCDHYYKRNKANDASAVVDFVFIQEQLMRQNTSLKFDPKFGRYAKAASINEHILRTDSDTEEEKLMMFERLRRYYSEKTACELQSDKRNNITGCRNFAFRDSLSWAVWLVLVGAVSLIQT